MDSSRKTVATRSQQCYTSRARRHWGTTSTSSGYENPTYQYYQAAEAAAATGTSSGYENPTYQYYQAAEAATGTGTEQLEAGKEQQ